MRSIQSIGSGEEFSLKGIEDGNPDSDEDEPQVESWSRDSSHVGCTSAHDIPHFFETIGGPESPDGPKRKICKICL